MPGGIPWNKQTIAVIKQFAGPARARGQSPALRRNARRYAT